MAPALKPNASHKAGINSVLGLVLVKRGNSLKCIIQQQHYTNYKSNTKYHCSSLAHDALNQNAAAHVFHITFIYL
jgi:hypothetical protein